MVHKTRKPSYASAPSSGYSVSDILSWYHSADAWTRAERLPIWPRVHGKVKVKSSTSMIETIDLSIQGCCRELLEAAFQRAQRQINSTRSAPPQLRVRAAGLRNDSAPPERQLCEKPAAETFATLSIEISSEEPTPLQFGVDESYALELTSTGGTLRAKTEWGALHGLESFASLVQYDGEKLILCGLPLKIEDSPTYGWRGLLLDTSRHFLPIHTAILPMLDAMSAMKLNVLHWHLTDAHSFPYGSLAVPELPAHGAYHPTKVYTIEEMKGIVAAANARGIRIVPELDMPAHTASWALGRPDLVVTCPERVASDEEGLEHGVNKMALHPLKEATYEVIEKLLIELSDIFPDSYLHLGGDEVDGDCWLADEDILAFSLALRKKMGTYNVDWKSALHRLFTARVAKIARRLGRAVILWDDALEVVHHQPPAPPDELKDGDDDHLEPSSIVVDVWRDWVRTNYERRDQAIRGGHKVIWSSLAWYQDLPGNTWDHMYNVDLPTLPEGKGTQSLYSERLLGGETSSWSEHADEVNLQERVLIRAAAVAERLWSGEKSEIDIARQRLSAWRCRMLRRGFRPSAVLPDACEAGTVASTPEEVPTIACVPGPAHTPAPCVVEGSPPPPLPMAKEDASPPRAWLVAGLVASGAINVALLAFVLCWRGSAKAKAKRA